MRVALVQFALTPDTRSANIASLMRMIDRACERDPAPDLLVLPAGCAPATVDFGAHGVTRAMGDTLAASLAMKAREWGVFVAGGFHTRDDPGPLVQGVLIDPDGDVLIRTRREDDAAGLLARVRTTSIGTVGLLLSCLVGDNAGDGSPEHSNVLVVPGLAQGAEAAASGAGRAPGALSGLARRCACYVCAAFPILPKTHGTPPERPSKWPSQVYAPDGSSVARARSREAVVMVELTGHVTTEDD